MRFIKFIALIFVLLLAACVPAAQEVAETGSDGMVTVVSPASTPAAAEPPSTITLPISVYIVDDESGGLFSARETDEIAVIYEKANAIWAQADIVLDVQTIQRLALPDAIMESIARGEFRPFFNGIEYDFTVPDPSLLNAFYARSIGGPNGITPFGANLFFVMDTPSVHDERVTSHEIGHILGLHHTRTDPDRLMFSGTNGMALTEEEIIVARYAAQGLLDRVR